MPDLSALFKLSCGMCIVGAKCENRINGCVVNTVFQVTAEPVRVAVSLNRQCLTCDYIVRSRVFAVSVLSEQASMRLTGTFGFRTGRDIDKFEHVKYRIGQTGSPIVLDNTVAFLEAEVETAIDLQTHTLFIAKVVACGVFDDSAAPMTYSYYRDIKHGRTPKSAATYQDIHSQNQQGVPEMKKYECTACGYIYDPEKGDPDGGIAPGTAFEDLPDDWVCPECGVGKDQFKPVEE